MNGKRLGWLLLTMAAMGLPASLQASEYVEGVKFFRWPPTGETFPDGTFYIGFDRTIGSRQNGRFAMSADERDSPYSSELIASVDCHPSISEVYRVRVSQPVTLTLRYLYSGGDAPSSAWTIGACCPVRAAPTPTTSPG